MNKRAEMIKTAIMQELAKEGVSLQDFEQHLANEKKAAALFDVSKAPEILKSFVNLYGASALAVGALGGTGLYAGMMANEDSTNQQLKRFKEKQQYDNAANSIGDRMKHPTIL